MIANIDRSAFGRMTRDSEGLPQSTTIECGTNKALLDCAAMKTFVFRTLGVMVFLYRRHQGVASPPVSGPNARGDGEGDEILTGAGRGSELIPPPA